MTITFSKGERLCSRKIIGDLFESGRTFPVPPFRVLWKNSASQGPFPVQTAISIPKHNFKDAVTRNLLRRRIREAYRKNKNILYDYLIPRQKNIALMIIYTGKEIQGYRDIENKIILTLQRLTEEHEKNTD
jgi:ribonuclease P protein component